jgi:hypothetical protein
LFALVPIKELAMRIGMSVSTLSIVLFLGACAIGDQPLEVGSTSEEVVSPNGMTLNGMTLNGMTLNGMTLNGMTLNGMTLNGMTLNGMTLNGMTLNGSELSGVSGGVYYGGEDLVGAKVLGQLSNGSTLQLRIDSAKVLPAPNDDVWAYEVLAGGDNNTWQPLCGTVDGFPILAVPLSGTWNYQSGVSGGGSKTASTTSFTFACRGTALAKCVELGYKPWDSDLEDHHQACTRMLRADYCGDGTPGTTNGRVINTYDDVGVQADTESWGVDAEWDADGARCVGGFTRSIQSCSASLYDSTCGAVSHFDEGTLLVDEYNGG